MEIEWQLVMARVCLVCLEDGDLIFSQNVFALVFWPCLEADIIFQCARHPPVHPMIRKKNNMSSRQDSVHVLLTVNCQWQQRVAG